MRIAVIGGGASGLSAAWLLDEAHAVTLYERAPILGGHIRTLGGNVPCASLPPGVRLDTGVIEFDRVRFPAFHAWMDAIGVPVPELTTGGTTNLFFADGRHLRSPGAIEAEHPRLRERFVELADLVPLAVRRRRFLRRAARASRGAIGDAPIGRFLGDDEFSVWVRCLLMYAYSTPYDQVEHLSSAMALPMLRDFLRPDRWTHLPSGVSSYVDRVARSLRGQIVLDARLTRVQRERGGVVLAHADGHTASFDAVVLAVPPHRVLGLLADPSDDERAWFGGFEGGLVHTVAHTDTGIYERRGVHTFAEFDLFELASGGHGYNAYLNRLAGLSEAGPIHYSLAFDLDAEIDPALVIHRQAHDVARYTQRALAARDDLRRRNGLRSTYFAGAFLGEGLHEGAVRSALEVASRLGGRSLPGFSRGSGRP